MNKILKKNSSFTLIELLVVIVIIGVLAGIVAVATSHFISTSHNTKLVGELSNLSKMLQGRTYYPAGNFCIEDDSNEDAKRFRIELGLDKVPRHPQYNDGDTHLTTNNCFLYFSDGDEYSIRLPALGNEGYLIQESRNPAVKPIQKACDEGWIPFGNRCIMQYEAKKGTGNIATSVATGTPWVSIYQDVAKAECEKINAHLITNAEWMAIARDIEDQDANWSDNKVGTGYLNIGHATGNSGAAATTGSASEYSTGSNTLVPFSSLVDHKGKRTHTLSNGQSIWDFSGNVWEWLDRVIPTQEGIVGSGAWNEINGSTGNFINWTTSTNPYLLYTEAGPVNQNLTSTHGIGKIAKYNHTDDRAFVRGGDWNNGALAGVFALRLSHSPSHSNGYIGFRCAR
jgi:prepilin-type N-terminal cleavage/methylation domain-containing protein